MTWQIEFLEEAKNDLKKLDHSSQIQVLKGIPCSAAGLLLISQI